jgi:hypothetical protein
MKKKYIILIMFLTLMGTWTCKQDFLNVPPAGSLDQTLLQSENGVEALLIGAYSMLDGWAAGFLQDGWQSSSTNWVFGSIRGMEALKGSDDADQPDINPIMGFSEQSTNSYLNWRWRAIYEGISRSNSVLIIGKKALDGGKITQAQYDNFAKQAKALRGWYHLSAWRMWEDIPYMLEDTDPAKVKNDVDVKPLIIADLTEGTTLPDDMGAIGKFNGTVSKVLLAEALMDLNKDYAGAKTLLQDVVTNGKKSNNDPIGLAPTYGEIFDIVNRNGIESVYTIQYSVNDGSGGWNGSIGDLLNFPYQGGPAGCCGMLQPTQELVNSFRTSGGLPLLDNSYDVGANQVKNDYGIEGNTNTNADKLAFTDPSFVPDQGPLDPRLDWTVGRRGIPYWDWGLHPGKSWVRKQDYGGVYAPKKAVFQKSQEKTYTDISSWTPGYTANGYRMIRFADVLLLLAECQIETNDLTNALTNINLVRARAANPAGFVKKIDANGRTTTVPAANYEITTYPTLGDQANARKILMMERKLELATEGHRYFDLNRWGVTVTELNRVLAYEKSMPWGPAAYGNAVVGPEDVLYPIPQRQIDLSLGNITQNAGH